MKGKYKQKDEHYFDNIDTEEKAYWLGFLFADGNISKPTRMINGKEKPWYRIEISLKEDDKDHLIKFKNALNAETDVIITNTNIKWSNRARFYFNSKHMWNILNSYGCKPNKSLTLTFPNINIFKNKNLIKHFIRGYVDGDGCLSYTDKEKNHATLSILGTYNMLSNIQHWLPLEFENKIYEKASENISSLTFSGKTAFYITNYLYKNSNIYLERKYNKYKEYCRLYLEKYKLQLGKYGELWEENSVVNSEIAKGSESPYSVESE